MMGRCYFLAPGKTQVMPYLPEHILPYLSFLPCFTLSTFTGVTNANIHAVSLKGRTITSLTDFTIASPPNQKCYVNLLLSPFYSSLYIAKTTSIIIFNLSTNTKSCTALRFPFSSFSHVTTLKPSQLTLPSLQFPRPYMELNPRTTNLDTFLDLPNHYFFLFSLTYSLFLFNQPSS